MSQGKLPVRPKRARIPNAILTLSPKDQRVGRSLPVLVTLRLQNAGVVPLVANCAWRVNDETMVPSAGEVYFVVEDPTGRSLPFAVLIRPRGIRQGDFAQIQPGESCASDPIDVASYFPIEQPGRYRIVATYCNGQSGSAFGLSASRGCTTSATARFEISDRSAEPRS